MLSHCCITIVLNATLRSVIRIHHVGSSLIVSGFIHFGADGGKVTLDENGPQHLAILAAIKSLRHSKDGASESWLSSTCRCRKTAFPSDRRRLPLPCVR
jgi:hypothetical protein